jgi:hypothetical protein
LVSNENRLSLCYLVGRKQQVKINKNERYHFLESVPIKSDVLGKGLPELTLDFKRYFTIPTEEVYYRLEIREA